MCALDALALYHRLPYPLKVAAASAHGLKLRRWRFGPETEGLVAEALERESWSAGRWASWHRDQLGALLQMARRHVPAYRDLEIDGASGLGGWPLLDKEKLRGAPLDFLDQRLDRRHLYAEHTSGTSGTPLRLFWSRHTVRAWYALAEARFRHWYGVSRRDPWAILGGQLVAEPKRRKAPFWVWNAGLRQLYLSSYHLEPDLVGDYLHALRRHRVRYLWGYPSALASLAAMTLEKGGGRDLGLQVAIANAEPVFEKQRQLVEEAFGCPLRETYGMAELAAAASECSHGRLHLWPEVGFLELLDGENHSVAPGEEGRLVATGLLSRAQPLIRYEVGDRLRFSTETECPCGRQLPILASVEGRIDDVITTPSGRKVGRLDPVFKADLPILEAQIVQESATRVSARYVLAEGASETRTAEQIRSRLVERLPDMEIEVRAVDAIPRGAQGKFRAVIGLGHKA